MIQTNEKFAAARKRAILSEFKRLNNMQREAVSATEGPLLLLAGAGSGKTTVVINRIANILKYGRASDSEEVPTEISADDIETVLWFADNPDEQWRERLLPLLQLEPAEPWRILAITFTNKAANEIKERLAVMLGSVADEIWAATFHSACVKILRRDIEISGIWNSRFTIYDSEDSRSLLKRIIKDFEIDENVFSPRTVAAAISRAKDSMIAPDEYADNAVTRKDLRAREIGKIYIEYARRCRDANALDFDDLILETVKLLQEHQDILQRWQHRFKYIMVDEYQDTSKLQYTLIKLLSGEYNNICVVGDDDQSIYRFRGATIENILSFENNFPGARIVRLEQNYRSTENILSAANAIISVNTSRKGKTLWTDNGKGDPLTLKIASDERAEADYAALQITQWYARGLNYRDIAILYRTNAQSLNFELAFKRKSIPYRVYGGMRFFDRAEIKDAVSYLAVVANTDDDLRLLRIINNPPRGIGQKTIDTVTAIATAEGKPIFEILRNTEQYPELAGSVAKLSRFTELINDLRSQVAQTRLDAFYDILLDKTGYVQALQEKANIESETRLENVMELKSSIIDYVSRVSENASLAAYLDEIALYTDIDKSDAQHADMVQMMTIHSAKGLEFPVVLLVGAEDGIFPGLRSIGEPDEMEEERRLCYVAMTRAKQKLYITSAKRRMMYGRTMTNPPSRFLDVLTKG
ncbi:MAG: UvrD-helicase domain-containing protein [Oscillospiraceae bacterium]|jgi:DNA helicase-2/ATP-dependent DNA helicase PcrA|nr:UvrD-helicase domain-containing protein [Oscillospiraceae bacterium]